MEEFIKEMMRLGAKQSSAFSKNYANLIYEEAVELYYKHLKNLNYEVDKNK